MKTHDMLFNMTQDQNASTCSRENQDWRLQFATNETQRVIYFEDDA